jgi:hypothetical protein
VLLCSTGECGQLYLGETEEVEAGHGLGKMPPAPTGGREHKEKRELTTPASFNGLTELLPTSVKMCDFDFSEELMGVLCRFVEHTHKYDF